MRKRKLFAILALLPTLALGGGVYNPTSAGAGGSGTVTNTGGNLTSNALVLGAGTADTKVAGGLITDGTSKITLGVAGASVGSIDFKNATSGTATISPPAGALGTIAVTLPNASSTLPIFGQQITFAGPTAARTVTLPDASFTAARTDAANTFTGTQTFGAVVGTTWNGNTWATGTGTLSIGAGKTATVSNTLTFTGTDSSSVAFGAGGTVLYNGATNAALTTPVITTGLKDANSNSMIAFTPTGSAVDGLTVTNAATANPAIVQLAATGTDANITLRLGTTGTGQIQLGNSTNGITATAIPPVQATTATAGNGITLRASDAVAGSSVAGAAAGGSLQIRAGDAARLTSGTAAGGDVTITSGALIGSGANGQILFQPGGAARASFTGGGTNFALGSGMALAWSSAIGTFTTVDTGLARNAAGVVEVNNGTAGTFKDLKLQNLIETALTATATNAPTIASAATIAPTVPITFISGTTQITTITAPSPISAGGGQITLIPTGLWTTGTSGNIALATTAVVSKALIMTYDSTTTKWYPSY